MAIAWNQLGVVSTGLRFGFVAPIDDGCDAPAICERLLRAVSSLLDHCEVVHTCEMTWDPPVLLDRRVFGREDRWALDRHVADRRSQPGIAASYCAGEHCYGFGLWQPDGMLRVFWAPQRREFDQWLRRTIPEFHQDRNRPAGD